MTAAGLGGGSSADDEDESVAENLTEGAAHSGLLGSAHDPTVSEAMGCVVGEKVTRAIELGVELRTPVLVCSASGGARMQEGTLSLVQMAKTAAALGRLAEAGVPGYDLVTWNLILGPPNMPVAVQEALNKALVASLAEPALRQRLLTAGVEAWTEANGTA